MKLHLNMTCCTLACILGAGTGIGRPMNVLMIAIDDMNDWSGYLGGPARTPNLDRLAAEGVAFEAAHCVVPACNPSRVALFTGQRPETTGQFENEGNFRERPGGKERITLPQFLMARGYHTVAAGKLFHHPRGTAREPRPLSDPLSWNEQRVGNTGTGGQELYRDEKGVALWHGGEVTNAYLQKSGLWGITPEKTNETQDWKTAAYCADYLRRAHDRPFFLACGIFRPHSPQLAPKEFWDLYDPDKVKVPDLPPDDMNDIPEIALRNFSSDFVDIMKKKGEWRNAVHGYLASCSFADACVGHVLDTLASSAYAENTLVILWSDHGWQLGHKDRWEKFSLWRQAHRSLLLIKAPGVTPRGGRVSAPVSFLDIYPTVLDLLGYERPAHLEGTSLLPQLKDPTAPRTRPAVVTYPKGNYSVREGPWNYIRYQDGSEEIYDHRVDPGEFRNLAADPAVRGVMDRLARWLPSPPPTPSGG